MLPPAATRLPVRVDAASILICPPIAVILPPTVAPEIVMFPPATRMSFLTVPVTVIFPLLPLGPH